MVTEIRRGQHAREEAIRNLTKLNGIPIAELERRMRPNKGEGAGPSMYSYFGFLGQNEDLIDVLLRQNEIVENSGFTHKVLANWLDLTLVHLSMAGGGVAYFEENGFSFQICRYSTVCDGQGSPFANPGIDNEENNQWYGEYVLRNLSTGRVLKFTDANIRWIREWGFYEGFETQYCVNPQAIIDIFNREDIIFETREVYIKRLISEYFTEGWLNINIDYPSQIVRILPKIETELLRTMPFEENGDSISQLLIGESLIVAMNGTHNQFRDVGHSFGVFDRDSKRLLLKYLNVGEFELERCFDENGESVLIKVYMQLAGKRTLQNLVKINSRPDANGWKILYKGEPDLYLPKHIWEFGILNLNQEDVFDLYSSDEVEFITHKRFGVYIFVYIEDKRRGWRKKIELDSDGLLEFGISSNQLVTEIGGIENRKGLVRGWMVAGGKKYGFDF